MKTWRERLADARQRGVWTMEDAAAWTNASGTHEPFGCPARQACRDYGLSKDGEMDKYVEVLFRHGDRFGPLRTIVAQHPVDFDECEKILDVIDDLALQLKRELQ